MLSLPLIMSLCYDMKIWKYLYDNILCLPGEFPADQRTGGSLVPLVQSLTAEVEVFPVSHHLKSLSQAWL